MNFKYFTIFILFLILSIFVHKKEIFNKDIVYKDNYYHYLIYCEKEKDLFKDDIIKKSLEKTYFKKLVFNPIILPIYSFSLNFFDTPKNVSVLLAIISQVLTSFIFFLLVKKIFLKTTCTTALLYSLFFYIFISSTDLFIPEFRRNIGFLIFIITTYNFYLRNLKLFIMFGALFCFLYSVTAPFILFLTLFYLIYLDKIKKTYYPIIAITLITIIFGFYDYLTNAIEQMRNGYEWKEEFNSFVNKFNFIENFFLNFNEYPQIYTYYFYSTILGVLVMSIIIVKERLEVLSKTFTKEDFIFILSVIVSFLASLSIISPGYASRQTSFSIPFFITIMFLKFANTIISELNINIKHYLILIILIFFVFLNIDTHFEKINFKNMENIKKSTKINSIIIAHPSEIFIPYFTKRTLYVIEGSEKIVCTAKPEFCKEIKKRYDNSLQLYYTDSFEKIKEIIEKEHIDFIIVDKKYYSKSYLESPKAYDKIRKLSYEKYLLNKEKKFKILELAEKYGTKIDDSVYFIEAKKIL